MFSSLHRIGAADSEPYNCYDVASVLYRCPDSGVLGYLATERASQSKGSGRAGEREWVKYRGGRISRGHKSEDGIIRAE